MRITSQWITWMREFAAHPPTADDVTHFDAPLPVGAIWHWYLEAPGTGAPLAWWLNRPLPRVSDPEQVLNLGPDGVPAWWPSRHPNFRGGERLTKRERRRWFVNEFGVELRQAGAILQRADARSRKRILGVSLLHMHSEWSRSTVAEWPIPDL